RLEPLHSFILPGGTPVAAWLHFARVVCRRAEIAVVALAEREPGRVAPTIGEYLNRLSDLLFVLARWKNSRGRRDLLWRPGAGQDAQPAPPPKRNPARAPARAGAASRRTPRRRR